MKNHDFKLEGDELATLLPVVLAQAWPLSPVNSLWSHYNMRHTFSIASVSQDGTVWFCTSLQYITPVSVKSIQSTYFNLLTGIWVWKDKAETLDKFCLKLFSIAYKSWNTLLCGHSDLVNCLCVYTRAHSSASQREYRHIPLECSCTFYPRKDSCFRHNLSRGWH